MIERPKNYMFYGRMNSISNRDRYKIKTKKGIGTINIYKQDNGRCHYKYKAFITFNLIQLHYKEPALHISVKLKWLNILIWYEIGGYNYAVSGSYLCI